MKILKIGDIISIAFVIALGIAAAFLSFGQKGELVSVYSDSNIYGEYLLSEDREICVKSHLGWNTIKISNGKVCVKDASCKDKLDVLQGEIYKSGQSIICLPNRLVVTIKGGRQTDALSY